MATIVAALEQRGLIERTPDPEDGRRQVISLTKAGRQRAESDRQVREEWLARAIHERYSESERRIILDALTAARALDRHERAMAAMELGVHFIDFLPGDPAALGPTLVDAAKAAEQGGARCSPWPTTSSRWNNLAERKTRSSRAIRRWVSWPDRPRRST